VASIKRARRRPYDFGSTKSPWITSSFRPANQRSPT